MFIARPGSHRRPIAAIALLSLALNAWGVHWGLPQRWHPDELVGHAEKMVNHRSLNPHHFAYGGLHFYQLMAAAVVPVKVLNNVTGGLAETTEQGLATLFGRLLSVVFGTGIVLLIYVIGRTLFSEEAGLWGALLLSVSMGFVNLAHFATTEIPSMFWFTASCALAAQVVRRPHPRWYWLAGFCAGLSAAVKYIGGLALLPLVVAHLAQRRLGHRWLGAAVFASAGGFVVGNPVLLFSCREFVEGFIREGTFNAARGVGSSRAFMGLLEELPNALGLPLAVLCLGGAAYSLTRLRDARQRTPMLFVWLMGLPHYLLMGSLHVSELRYIVPDVPALALLGGLAAERLVRVTWRPLQLGVLAALGFVVGYSALYAGAADLYFVQDARVLAREWILRHVEPGATVEMTSYGPDLSGGGYRAVQRPHDSRVDGTMTAAHAEIAYTLSRLPLGEQRSYQAWYEIASADYARDARAFDLSLDGLLARRPEYVITSTLYTDRFAGDPLSAEGALYERLSSGGTGYVTVATFHRRFLPGVDPDVEFVNPTITIFHAYDQLAGDAR